MASVRLKQHIYRAIDEVVPSGFAKSIGGVRVRLPFQWYRYYKREYEPENVAFARRSIRPGTLAVDVGAHIGLYSALYAKLVGTRGRVIALEPTPATFGILKEVLKLNGADNVRAIMAAAADRACTKAFYLAGPAESVANSLVPMPAGHGGGVVVTRILAIDEVVRDSPLPVSLIKIDAEGAEGLVLKGARATASHWRPNVILGVHPRALIRANSSLAELWSVIASLGYVPTLSGQPVHRAWFLRQANLFDVQLVPSMSPPHI